MLRNILFLVLFLNGTSAFCQPFRNEWIDYSKTYYKIPVATEGLYRISKATLTSLNLGDKNAEDFQLWRDGAEQPIYTSEATGPLASNGYIEFYGRQLDGSLDTDLFPDPENHVFKDLSFFTDTACYFLTLNEGKQNLRFVNEVNTVNTTTLVPDSFFLHTNSTNFFDGAYAFNFSYGYARMPFNQQGDLSGVPIRSSVWDQGEGFASTPFGAGGPINVKIGNLRAFNNGGNVSLKYSLIGSWGYDRTISVAMNDSVVAEVFVPDYELRKNTINDIPISRIRNDSMTFRFFSDNSKWPEMSQVNALYLTYPRKFNFNNLKVFNFKLPLNANGNHLRISNFNFGAQPPVLLDLTNLKRYIGTTTADSSLFALKPSATERRLVIANQADFVSNVALASVKTIQFTNFSSIANQGDYLIISSNRIAMYEGKNMVDAYRQYRSSTEGGNYNARVIDIEELYDQYSFGIRKNPLAIRNFVSFAVKNFQVKPKFVFLIGRAVEWLQDRYNFNYTGREYLNAVPTWGAPGSDNLLVSVSKTNPTPLVAVGRLSAINGKEINDYLEKLKEYDQLGNAAPNTPANKDWKKHVVQLIGGDDVYFSSILGNFMNNYKKTLTDTFVGAQVKTYSKVDKDNFANNVVEMTKRINDGVGLINYFGHSSTSSIDFNLGSPDDFTFSKGKYPVVIANGCKAGDIFFRTPNRLEYYGLSISERFVLAPEKGAIAFISNSDYGLFNYLNIFTAEWMKSSVRKNYGKGIGTIEQEAIKNAFAVTGSADYYNKLNLEQAVLHGDPALIMFPENKPDFTTTDSLVSVSPLKATVAEDSLLVKAKILNLGKANTDSVVVEIAREFPDGRVLSVIKLRLKKLIYQDSISVKIPVKGIFDQGTNYIKVNIDPANDWSEISETNNSVIVPFVVTDEEIRPVYPYQYSIINKPGFLLTGSTVNAITEERTYRLQVDTTELFNSPALFTTDTTTIGGAVSYDPAVAWSNGTVYYWRLAPVFNGIPVNWRTSSFQYLPGIAPGWGQSHFYQHTKSEFMNIALDSTGREFKFGSNAQNLNIINSIYGFSGDEDSHFSISVNGDYRIYSACVGQSIIFNVYDTLTFKPWTNMNERYGSGAFCGPGREFNFEFSYFPASNRKKIMDFIDSIPKGMFVSARLVLDPPYDSSFAKYWQSDTAIFGAGKSLYHSLLNQGFYKLDSMNSYRTFSFLFKKDDSITFKPISNVSAGLYDRLNNSYFLNTVDSIGEFSSPVFGPALAWKEQHWMGHQPLNISSDSYAAVQLIGIDKKKKETVLKTYLPGEWDNDISTVDAATYPNLRLKMLTRNKVIAKPFQLDYWRLFYEPIPDGALSALDSFAVSHTVISQTDSFRVQLAFKNISAVLLDSCSVNVTIANRDGILQVAELPKLKPLMPGDTAMISFARALTGLDGKYYAYIQVNKQQQPTEQQTFNNFTYIPFEVGTLLPVTVVDFTAKAENATVRLDWKATNESGISSYTVEHSKTGIGNFSSIGIVPAKNENTAGTPYNLVHTSPAEGANYYRLKIVTVSGAVEYSAIRQVNFHGNAVVNIYPNPFFNKISVSASGNQSWMIELFSMQGQRILVKSGTGNSAINTRNLPAGSYMLKLYNNNTVSVVKLEKVH